MKYTANSRITVSGREFVTGQVIDERDENLPLLVEIGMVIAEDDGSEEAESDSTFESADIPADEMPEEKTDVLEEEQKPKSNTVRRGRNNRRG